MASVPFTLSQFKGRAEGLDRDRATHTRCCWTMECGLVLGRAPFPGTFQAEELSNRFQTRPFAMNIRSQIINPETGGASVLASLLFLS